MMRSRGRYRIAVDGVPARRTWFYGLWLVDGMSERRVVGPVDMTYRTLRARFGERVRLVDAEQAMPPLLGDPPAPEPEPVETPEPVEPVEPVEAADDQKPERRRRRR